MALHDALSVVGWDLSLEMQRVSRRRFFFHLQEKWVFAPIAKAQDDVIAFAGRESDLQYADQEVFTIGIAGMRLRSERIGSSLLAINPGAGACDAQPAVGVVRHGQQRNSSQPLLERRQPTFNLWGYTLQQRWSAPRFVF